MSEVGKKILKNSLKEGNFFFLHSYHLKLDDKSSDTDDTNNNKIEVKTRFSIHIRTFLSMVGISEHSIYTDADS